MQAKTGFDTPIFNYILPFLYKSQMISSIYHKYGKSIIEIILLLASYAMGIPWNNFLIQIQSFSLTDYSYFYGSVRKYFVFIFEKYLLFTRN